MKKHTELFHVPIFYLGFDMSLIRVSQGTLITTVTNKHGDNMAAVDSFQLPMPWKEFNALCSKHYGTGKLYV